LAAVGKHEKIAALRRLSRISPRQSSNYCFTEDGCGGIFVRPHITQHTRIRLGCTAAIWAGLEISVCIRTKWKQVHIVGFVTTPPSALKETAATDAQDRFGTLLVIFVLSKVTEPCQDDWA
jgi:hypothetical protein